MGILVVDWESIVRDSSLLIRPCGHRHVGSSKGTKGFVSGWHMEPLLELKLPGRQSFKHFLLFLKRQEVLDEG